MAPRKTALAAVPKEGVAEEEVKATSDEIKETKYDNLLNYLRTYEDEYVVSVYKKQDGKRFLVAKFENALPDPIKDIRDSFGGGEYRYMIHSLTGAFVDSADQNILAPIESAPVHSQPSVTSRKDILDEIKAMAEIIGTTHGDPQKDNTILLELMKMQASQAKALQEMQSASEQRMIKMMSEMQSKKPALSEILEVVEFVDNLKGGSTDGGILGQVLNSPVAAPIIARLLSPSLQETAQNGGSPQVGGTPTPIQAKKRPQIAQKLTAQQYFEAIPDDFKTNINKDNMNQAIELLLENNKEILTRADAQYIINSIIAEKEVPSGNK